MPGVKQRKCTYSECDNPRESSRFIQIEEGKTTGGQDWSSLVGNVLCAACHKRFKTRGTLERAVNKPLTGSARRCTYSGCDNPRESSNFYQIEEGKTAGGQDWSSLAESVLCMRCYDRFKNRGTLERAQFHNKLLIGSARRCTYDHCHNPTNSSSFNQIEEGKTTGGQDWSSVVGSVLCEACYTRFKRRGTLERAQFQNKPLTGSARRCTYDHCDDPTNSSQFYQIGEGKTTGGQDWSTVVGSVLCAACYHRFRKRGTLEPSTAHIRKKQKTNRHPKASRPTSSKTHPSACTSYHEEEEEEEEEAPDTGECMVCLDDSRSMCIVPCGHFGLCATCGDEGVFAGEKRPYSECPICREEMCEPYVMERWVWEELGGTTYYS